MTILDAIEKAKRLYREKAASAGAPQNSRPGAIGDTSFRHDTREHAAVEAQPTHYAELGRVVFDARACQRNAILLTQEQLDRNGGAAAAYRMLRGRMLNRAQANNWSCIGITGPGIGEGKSVTALNLAINIARDKRRFVYLLDLDMRSPSVFAYVGLKPPRPLADFFLTDVDADSVLFATDVDNLVIAGNASPTAGSSELLASRRLDELLGHIRRRSPTSLVIIDLPPILSTDEALVVAPRVDATFLVVSEGKTRRDLLERSVSLLSDFNLGGVILNRSGENVAEKYHEYGAAPG